MFINAVRILEPVDILIFKAQTSLDVIELEVQLLVSCC